MDDATVVSRVSNNDRDSDVGGKSLNCLHPFLDMAMSAVIEAGEIGHSVCSRGAECIPHS